MILRGSRKETLGGGRGDHTLVTFWNCFRASDFASQDSFCLGVLDISICVTARLCTSTLSEPTLLRPGLSICLYRLFSLLHSSFFKKLKKSVCLSVDPDEGVFVLLPAESQQRMVQLLYFLSKMSQPLLANLSCCCTTGRISAGLAASLIRIINLRWAKPRVPSSGQYYTYIYTSLNALTFCTHSNYTWINTLFFILTDTETNWQFICHCLFLFVCLFGLFSTLYSLFKLEILSL